MKARELINNSSYGPNELKVMFEAFDEAWNELAPTVGVDPAATEAARLKLANTILSLAKYQRSDPDSLKAAALRIMGSSS
jgi:hypothetical protein